MAKHIHLVSFLIHSPINHTVLSWADPRDNRLEALGSLRRWQELAQTLERGMFDGIFFADTPGVFDRYRDWFFRPFGEGSQRWALAPALA